MIYIDTTIFILALSEDKRAKKAEEILTDIALGKTIGVTSALTIEEVVWILWKETKDKEHAIKETQRILKLSSLKIIPVNKEIMEEALELMKTLKAIKPRDAIHLASCFYMGITTIASDDTDFDNISGIKRLSLN